MSTNQSKKKNLKIIIIVLAIVLAIGGYFGIKFYNTYFAPNVTDKEKYLYVKTGYVFEDLVTDLRYKEILNDIGTFWQAAEKMNLQGTLKPGKYRLKEGMTNRALINMLKAGNQEPVKLKFQNIRKIEGLASLLAKNLEPDSVAFMRLLDSAAFVEKYGFTTETVYTMFIPNTYEMYWSTSREEFFKKMNAEYLKFWNDERRKKAAAIGLDPIKATILASIVDAEALYDREMPTIAGLYLNRLERGILLQADPTVIFANNDFTVKRVTGPLLRVDSRYNTYKYAGLPPGPINMPSISAIDAVLNKEDNNYLYMCAKEDFSGYHNFAATVQEHNINAKKYREALNKRNIFR
ncbi:MAG: endolytic transglycosylase MltG [Pedobacter sp.]|uniref:endolytic transglycosylase MltG n=1 Tax=Pedobacter sp. TaxID=1411316 RepID=UPI0028071F78|nr:endolytic transglycosylase MltG [Pedobacter sp.]MDQ8005367.1 endolytic transglycosylase MltG [Pedobacter sp.]